jgi:hypothetical protein
MHALTRHQPDGQPSSLPQRAVRKTSHSLPGAGLSPLWTSSTSRVKPDQKVSRCPRQSPLPPWGAFEAVVWSQPIVMLFGTGRGSLAGLGIKDNDILAKSRPINARHGFLTANNDTPCIFAYADPQWPGGAGTARGIGKGNVVRAGGRRLQGYRRRHWPVRPGQGQGGKYLCLPPPRPRGLPGRPRQAARPPSFGAGPAMSR